MGLWRICAVAVAKQFVCPSPAATPEVTEVVTSLFEPDVCSGGSQGLATYVLEPGALRMLSYESLTQGLLGRV